MDYSIKEIVAEEEKSTYTKEILDKLPTWFGLPGSNKKYIAEVQGNPFWAAFDGGKCVGFFSGKIHYGATGDIFVCGVDPEYHNKGIGKALYARLEDYFRNRHCKHIIVKTLSEIARYEPYDRTKTFYKSIGFNELLTLTEMWDDENPCLIMIKDL